MFIVNTTNAMKKSVNSIGMYVLICRVVDQHIAEIIYIYITDYIYFN